MPRAATALFAGLLACMGTPAAAQGYRAVAENAAILYDAPSVKAKKLYVVNRGYPLEIAVAIEGWTKVRDAAGEFTWIESRLLTERRTVMIRPAAAPIRQSADDAAPVVFQARQNVILDLLEPGPTGWVRVRHQDGQTGFLRTAQAWGA